MQVNLNNTYPLAGGVEQAWLQLQDIEAVAGCMPGAEITEVIDDHHYRGKVKVKLGPVTAAFDGTIEVKEVDADNHRIKLLASGKDSKGTSTASMDLTAQVQAVDGGTSELVGDAAVVVNGKLANFGGRMMNQVADQVLGQFADNFATRVGTAAAADSAPETDAGATTDVADGESAAAEEAAASGDINALKFGWKVLIGYIKSFFKRSA